MSKTLSYIIILSLVLVTVLGVGIGIWNYQSQQGVLADKNITLEDGQQTSMSAHLKDICPGDKASYSIQLKGNKGDKYAITMDFIKLDTDSLAKFVDVQINVNDVQVEGAKLSELLGGKQTTFSADFVDATEIKVEIVYSMSIEVGDEAQNTTADFNVVLSANR